MCDIIKMCIWMQPTQLFSASGGNIEVELRSKLRPTPAAASSSA